MMLYWFQFAVVIRVWHALLASEVPDEGVTRDGVCSLLKDR